MRVQVTLVFILFIFFTNCLDPSLYLVKLQDPAALCTDGSPGGYYISKDGNHSKIYIQFGGGGWCWGPDNTDQILQSCYERSTYAYDTSKDFSEKITMSNGVLSTNQNNYFRDWTRVLLRYCDGTGTLGYRQDPVSYNGKNLYFRGFNITVAQLERLENHTKLFSLASQVVIGGDSAGGIAATMWANYLKSRVKRGRVWLYVDSGIFASSANFYNRQKVFKNSFKNLLSVSNPQLNQLVPQCMDQHPNEPQNCMFIENLYQHLKVPLFIGQSLYDRWSIENILGLMCVNNDNSFQNCGHQQMKAIEQYHEQVKAVVKSIGEKQKNGFWAISCSTHVFCFYENFHSKSWTVPKGSDNTVVKVLAKWIENQDQSKLFRYMDEERWPDNKACSGKK